ncbi:MAG: transaldolase / glucose-6-phosphate isomerase [Candidatus Atribacteria bacterium]|nr:transaldolase / glucose-6-phosphate isomerase [Candidatus Atribacteria bacterium]
MYNQSQKVVVAMWPYPFSEIYWGNFEQQVKNRFQKMQQERVVSRLFAKDYTLWKPSPEEITNRLGWLDSPEQMKKEIKTLKAFAEELQKEGFKVACLLGMGGSSLAPEMFSKVFGKAGGFLDLLVLDSTDPDWIAYLENKLPCENTVFIVSTKSGTTAETLAFFRYFFHKLLQLKGKEAGKHFVAITDPGSPLEEVASRYLFRKVFLNNPDIGGRYSALSFFGLVSASLLGIDLGKLLDRATLMRGFCSSDNSERNPAVVLATYLGELALLGRDKATFFFDPPSLSSFGDWIEQLIAESTGKEGKGILPVVTEKALKPEDYGSDRAFIFIEGAEGSLFQDFKESLRHSGHPVLSLRIGDFYDIGGLFFLWEMAVALAGHILQINPFDQPNVESTKAFTRALINDYMKKGKLSQERPLFEEDGVSIFGNWPGRSCKEVMRNFVKEVNTGGYIAVQAFIAPFENIKRELEEIAFLLQKISGVAVTIGFGPRFLHSTGQLHKGDAGKGIFLQFLTENQNDLVIPELETESRSLTVSRLTFSVLKKAQALGDREALREAGRKVLGIQLERAENLLTVKKVLHALLAEGH